MLRRIGLLAFSLEFFKGGGSQRKRIEHHMKQAREAGLPVTPEVIKAFSYTMQAAAVGLHIPFLRRVSALILAAQLPVVTFIGHRFWELEEPQRGQQLTHFLKNASMFGGALFIAGSK
jgi:uncharacterized membrane protein YphA (DoxX/SURF4 family)